MAEYYALGAGLPTLRPEIGKNPPLTPWEYVEALRGQFNRRDNQLLDLLLLSEDNRALVALLYDRPIPEPQTPYVVGQDELRRLVTAAEGEKNLHRRIFLFFMAVSQFPISVRSYSSLPTLQGWAAVRE